MDALARDGRPRPRAALPNLDIEGEHLLPEPQYEIGPELTPHDTEQLVGV
jgi:hypothetical protein